MPAIYNLHYPAYQHLPAKLARITDPDEVEQILDAARRPMWVEVAGVEHGVVWKDPSDGPGLEWRWWFSPVAVQVSTYQPFSPEELGMP